MTNITKLEEKEEKNDKEPKNNLVSTQHSVTISGKEIKQQVNENQK